MFANFRKSFRSSLGAEGGVPRGRGGVRRKLRLTLFSAVFAALLLVLAWFFLTGSWFLTSVVLPFLGSRAGVEIAADRVDLSLFRSRVAFEKLRIGPESRPLFSADRGEGAFARSALFGGPLKFSDVTLIGAALTLYYHSGDKTWSVFPAAPEGGKTDGAAAGPFRIDLTRVTVRDSRFRMIFGDPEAGSAFELSGLDFTSGRFANGAPFAIDGTAKLRLSSSRANHIDAGKAKFSCSSVLGSNLTPESFRGRFVFSGLFGSISGEPLNDASLDLAFQGGLKNDRLKVEKFTLLQSQGGRVQSDVEFSGEVGFHPVEIRAEIDIRRLSEEVTSLLFDLGFGFNPGRAAIQYRGGFSYGNRRLAATGTLRIDRSGDAMFGLERIALSPFRLDGEHDFAIDLEDSSIDLRRFSLTLSAKERETASFRLRRPIRYSWRPGTGNEEQRTVFDFNCNSFDLKLLRLLTPNDSAFRFNSGSLTSKLQLTLRHNLSAVSLLGSGQVSNGSCRWDGRNFELSELLTGLDMDLGRDFHWTLRNLSLALKNADTDLGSANFSGEGELTDLAGKLSGRLERLTPELAAWLFPSFAKFLPEYRKLKLGTLEVGFDVEKPSGSEPAVLKTLTAGIDREGQRALELKTAAWKLDGDEGGDLKVRLTGQLPVSAFNPYLNGAATMESGSVRLAVDGSFARDFHSAMVSGELSLDDLAAKVGEREYRNFSGQCAFSFFMPSMSLLEFRTLNFYLRRSGKPALRLECPGTWDLAKDSYTGEWAIRYLNDQFLELVAPGTVSEAQLTGKLQVAAADHFRTLRAAGGVELSGLLPAGWTGDRLAGNLTLSVERDERRLLLRRVKAGLKQGDTTVFDLDGECRVDLSSPDGPVTVQLAASEIDAQKLLALIPDNAKVEPEPEATAAVPQLDFGSRPVDFGCRLEKVRFTPELTADFDTRIHLRRGSILSDHLLLQVNNARYDGEFQGNNGENGIAFTLGLRGNEPLSIPPLMELMVGSPQTGATGTLRDFSLSMQCLENGRPESYLETMSGSLAMDFRDLRIPNNVVNGPYAKVLLLPIEMAGQLDVLLPGDVAAWKERIVKSGSLRRQLRTIELSEGRVRLRAVEGKVRVDECAFFGDWVSRLVFSGEFDLAGEQRLRLDSKLTVSGIQTTIPVGGTLNAPEIRLGSVASDSLGSLLRKIGELKLIGTSADPSDPDKVEPVIMLDKLPAAGTIRELHQLFKGLWDKD